MADIRINSLPTTAVASSSDDFLALDGTTNGTRKLNAYSPTFGGNLTVNGTGTSSFSGSISVSGGGNDGTYGTVLYLAPSGFTTYRHAISTSASAGGPTFNLLKFSLANGASTTTDVLTLIGNGNATLAGNFTVSGTGTHSFNGPVLITGTSASNLLRLTKSGAGSKTFGIDNALDFRIYADNGSTQLFKLTDSGDTTITGNLTVSGGTITGGTSGMSLASGGTNQNITLTPSGTGFVTAQSSSSTGDVFKVLASGGAGLLLGQNSSAGQGPYIFSTGPLRFGADQTERGRFAASTGNFLIGTTTDSSNGKIQLADHTTSAGGIGFGTDISLFRRTTNGGLALNATSGRPFLYFRNNSIDTASVGTIDGDLYVTVPTAKNIYFSTNDTIALTLDSNRNATFTGTGTFNKFLSVNFGADNCFFTGNPGGSVFFRTALDATAGTQTRNSPSALFRGAYWNGSATTNIDATVQVTASTTVANNSLDFGFTSGGGTQSLRIFQSGDASFAGTIATQGGTASTPANAFATGTAGTIRWDASYIYVCTAANTWKRAAIAAW